MSYKLLILLAVMMLGATWLIATPAQSSNSTNHSDVERAVSPPLMFIENVGQFADDARFQTTETTETIKRGVNNGHDHASSNNLVFGCRAMRAAASENRTGRRILSTQYCGWFICPGSTQVPVTVDKIGNEGSRSSCSATIARN